MPPKACEQDNASIRHQASHGNKQRLNKKKHKKKPHALPVQHLFEITAHMRNMGRNSTNQNSSSSSRSTFKRTQDRTMHAAQTETIRYHGSTPPPPPRPLWQSAENADTYRRRALHGNAQRQQRSEENNQSCNQSKERQARKRTVTSQKHERRERSFLQQTAAQTHTHGAHDLHNTMHRNPQSRNKQTVNPDKAKHDRQAAATSHGSGRTS